MASSTVTLVSTPAGPPFADADADLVLRSSDNVDFHVHKFLLSLTSPVFRDILSIPDTTIYSGTSDEPHDVNEHKDGALVITLTEHRQVLENLLRLVYPTDNGKLADLSSVRELFQALDKYGMLDLFPQTLDRNLRDIARAHPFAAYAIACRYQKLTLANEIAPFTLQQPFLVDVFDEEDVDFITTYQYNQLHQYHQKCHDSSLRAVQAFSQRDNVLRMCALQSKINNKSPYDPRCHCPSASFHARSFPKWFTDYLDRCEAALKIAPYWQTVVTDELLVSLITAVLDCPGHRLHVNEILQMCHRLETQIKSKIERNALPFPQDPQEGPFIIEKTSSLAFFTDATADLILRSSDNVDFHVHSWILSKASPTLKRTILSEAHRREPSDDGVRIIQMTENHQGLESFLRLICPTDNPKQMLMSKAEYSRMPESDMPSVHELFQAVEKYRVLDLFHQTLEGVLLDIAVTRPFAAYAVACHYRMFTTANSLARLTLRMPFLADTFRGQDIQLMTVRQYKLLLQYHQKCSDSASEALGIDRIPPEVLRVAACSTCGADEQHNHARGIVQYLNDYKAVVQTRPLGDSLLGDALLQMAKAKCSNCSPLEKLLQCSQLLKAYVSSAIDKVPPPFPEAATEKQDRAYRRHHNGIYIQRYRLTEAFLLGL